MIVITAASIALFALVVGRMWGLVRQREKSVGRERALTAAGGLLVAATSLQQTAAAGLRAVAELAGSGTEARLCRVTGDEVRVSAIVDDELTRWTGTAAVAAAMRGRTDVGTATFEEGVRTELRLAPAHRTALIISLSMPDRAELLLVVAGRSATAPETQYALRSLAHQIALALESAELSEEVHRRASEARFATLVQNSTDLITVLGADGTVLYQSPSIEARPRLRRGGGHRRLVRVAAAPSQSRAAC